MKRTHLLTTCLALGGAAAMAIGAPDVQDVQNEAADATLPAAAWLDPLALTFIGTADPRPALSRAPSAGLQLSSTVSRPDGTRPAPPTSPPASPFTIAEAHIAPADDDGMLDTGGAGDLTEDGTVGAADLLMLLDRWGHCADPFDCRADLNGDGIVNETDLRILLLNWR